MISDDILKSELYRHIDDIEEEIKEIKENSYLSVGELSSFKNSDEIKKKITNEITDLYRSMEAFDSEGGNMLSCLGRINYHGSDHCLCEMVMDTVYSDVESKVTELPTQDLVLLFDDIQQATEDFVLDIEDWQHFRESLFRTYEIEEVCQDIREMVFNNAPKYFPFAEDDLE